MLESSKSNKTLYVGVDESNHGNYPETFVAVYSNFAEDISKTEGESRDKTGKIPKAKKDYPRIRGQVVGNPGRDYTFLQLHKNDAMRIPEINLLGHIIGSLIQGELPKNTNLLKILLDGEWSLEKRLRIKDITSEFCEFSKSQILLNWGRDFDRIYPLVNMADGMARNIHRNYTSQMISRSSHEKLLIY